MTDAYATARRRENGPPLAFAHRGGMATAPGNSLAAFTAALARGVTALESDVWLDSAGRAVLSHRRPKTTALGLQELFQTCGVDVDLCLDVRDPEAAPAAIATGLSAGHDPGRLWLCGRGLQPASWRALHPQVRLVTDTRLAHALPRPARYLDRLRAGGVSAVNLRATRWSTSIVRRVHAAGLLAFAWDVQTGSRCRSVLALGCDAIYSDHLDVLLQAVAERW